MKRNKTKRLSHLDTAKSGCRLVPYSTIRRWRLNAKLNEEQLKERGVDLGRPQQKILEEHHNNDMPGTSHDSQLRQALDPSTSCIDGPRTGAAQKNTRDCPEDVGSDSSLDSVQLDSDFSSISSGSYSESDFSASDADIEVPNMNGNKSNLDPIIHSMFVGVEALSKPLHPSLGTTKFEALLMILHLYMRHKMSDAFLLDLLGLVNKIVGVKDALPESKDLFHKLFLCGSELSFHFYCPNCLIYLGYEKSFFSGEINCENCDWSSTVSSHKNNNYFLTFNLREQIYDVLSRPGVKLKPRDQSNENVISDIMDAKEYKSLTREGKILSNPNALTVTFKLDASPVLESGSNSLWPIHFYLNELDASQRFKADNILLGGLWFGECEANLQVFMQPFVEQLKELQNEGVIWKKADGVVVESPVYAICCCCDTVAKPKVQCHVQFNRALSCSYCLHPNHSVTVLEREDSRSGIFVQSNRSDNDGVDANSSIVYRRKKVMRYLRGQYEMRTNSSLRDHMSLASESNFDHVMGVTGVSVLCELKHFDVVYGFPIDYMHAVLLGTVQQLVGYWLDTTSKGLPYYIGKSLELLDRRIKSIKLPTGIRPPRLISDKINWNANEWRAFLFYFGLPVLVHILPSLHYNHFKKLVTAVYTLTKESINYDEIDSANKLLQEFVWEYQDLYGEENMVYNVHITGHLAQLVARKGPLWTSSAFPFESANGRLASLARDSKGAATQIGKKYLLTKGATKLLCNGYAASNGVLDYCCKLLGYRYLDNPTEAQDGESMLGVPFYYNLDDAQKQVFTSRNIPVPNVVLAVKRVVVDGKLYHSRLSSKQKVAFDSCVRLASGEFALIDLAICEESSSISFLVTKLNIATDPSPLFPAHIKQCSLDSFGDVDLINSKDIFRKCIYFSCNDKNYVTEFSNFYEAD